jgi:heptosyltransferase-2
LIVSPTGHLGDSVMLLPMIERLRRTYPSARIDCVVEAAAALLLRQVREIDEVHGLVLGAQPPATTRLAMRRAISLVRLYYSTLRGLRPTVCILPRWGDDLFRATTLAYLIGSPRRIGFRSDDGGAPRARYRDALLTECVAGGRGMHEPARSVYLLQRAGVLPAEPLAHVSNYASAALCAVAERTDWPELARRLGIGNTARFAVIAPGASLERRVWPVEHWVSVARTLRTWGFTVVILSGPQDAALAQSLHRQIAAAYSAVAEVGAAGAGAEPILVAGATSLPETVALLAHAQLFLGSDSGPGHVAGALGIASVILFVTASGVDPDHYSAPARVRPLGPAVACCSLPATLPPCAGFCASQQSHCIALIEPETVLSAAARLLDSGRSGHATLPCTDRPGVE